MSDINKKEKILKGQTHLDNFKEKYIKLIDLINKKEQKLNILKKNTKIMEIIENNDINVLLNDFVLFSEKMNLDMKKEKDEIKKILISLSIENRIKKLIDSIYWILNNFKEYIKYRLTPFYDFIKNIYKSFEKKTITISILNDCINFLKSKNIIEENISNINKDLLIDFLALINTQIKSNDNAIDFCIKKTENEIEDIINNIKNSDINFLNLNDINDFKSCCNFFKEFISEKIDNDVILLTILKNKFNKDISIYTKFKNYLRYYKNIDLLNKESTINTQFQSTVDNILDNSELIIKSDRLNNVKCELIINNDIKNFEEIYEIKEMFLINYKYDKNRKKFQQFFGIVDWIKKLIENMNYLYQSGYPFQKEFYLKIEKGIFLSKNDNNKIIELSELISQIKELNNSFKKLQINYFDKNQVLTLINGKLYTILLNNYLNEEKDVNIKKEVNNILKYVSSNMIHKELDNIELSKEKIINSDLNYYFELLIQYFQLTFELNNITLEKILQKNFIRDEFNYIKNSIFYIDYNKEDLEYNILNIYQEITGNYPINNTILICTKDTTFEKIYTFLFSFFLCQYPVLFMLINIEVFDLSFKYKIILLIQKLNKIYFNRKSSLIILGQKNSLGNNNEFNLQKKINEISDNKIIMLDKKEEKNIKYKYNNVKIFCSGKSGLGVSSYIKHQVLNENKSKYIYFPIGGIFTRKDIMERLKNINFSEDENCVIHIEIYQTNFYSLLREFLFKLLVLKFYDFSNDIFYLGEKIKIIIELPFNFVNYFSVLPFLKIFQIINIENIYPLRISNIKNDITKMKIKESNILIVANTLNYYNIQYINKINIDLESENKLSEEKCQEILDELFKTNNLRENHYQREMLINFLSVQFKAFIECPYLNISEKTAENFKKIVEARPKVIEALINTGILLISGPYDKLIEIQKNNFKEEDDNNINEIRKKDLENDMDVINYDSIKGCLFFFNEDNKSFTIITNDKENEDYNLFMSLYDNNYNNKEEEITFVENKEIINYNNLSHDEYIKKLKTIFNVPKEKDINEIAKKNGNYVFTRDNFIKMILIYLRIKSNIPVILMGETGCGKTSLIKMLSLIIHKGENNLKIMNINEGVSDQDIINFIKKCGKEINEEKIWIFFDEINMCESLGLLSEIIIKRTMLGEKISDKFIFLGSCNPYRKMTEKMLESGLIFIEEKKKNKFYFNKDDLVYKVNPLPFCLINYVFNFGSLSLEDEKKYASSIIDFYFNKIEQRDKNPENIKLNEIIYISQEKLAKEKKAIVEILIFCNEYLKKIYDNSSISLRDIRRFTTFYDWFFKYLINESLQNETYRNNSELLLEDCLKLTIYLCYYLRITNPIYRKDFSKKISFELDKDFLEVPLREEKYITNQFILDNDKGIVLNRMLRENLLTLFVCINNREPLIIIGKPGSGKTLSVNCIADSMKGEFSENELLKRRLGLLIYRYQGTKNTNEKNISKAFKIVRSSIDIFKKNNEGIKLIPVFLFDEMGLVQRIENNNPLKVLHTELEFEHNVNKNDKICFIGISNWKLDSAKMNRALYLLVADPDENDLIDVVINIGNLMNKELFSKYIFYFYSLVKTYNAYKKLDLNKEFENIINKEENNIYYYLNDFHGNRDFYYFIKSSMNDLIEQKDIITRDNIYIILTKIGLKNIEKNFGGLFSEILDKIKKIFSIEFPLYKLDINDNIYYNPISFIEANLDLDNNNKSINNNSRYLMLLNNSPIDEFLIKSILKYIGSNNNYYIIKGSPFLKDLEENEGNYYKKNFLKKFEKLTIGNNIIIMKDLESIYPSLFNLFDKNFIKLKEKDIYSNTDLLFEINPNMKIIILTCHKKLSKENLPFINRFEKHIISINNLLNKEYINIAEKIWKDLNIITFFNNNKKLKINLKDMLIIKHCEEIAGLIYKIINMNNKANIEEEIYKILVPTFSQDLIISIKYSGFEKKNKKLCDCVYKIYKEKYRYNFMDFFNKINFINDDNKNVKYIIYTFSDINKISNIIIKNNEYKNLIISEIFVDDFKSEKDIDIFLTKIYNEKNMDLLITHFSEADINKIEYLTYKISQYELELKIIFVIHLKRKILSKENNIEKNNILYSTNNLLLNIDEDNKNYYEHIFIDNLFSSEDYFSSLVLNEYNNININEIIKKMFNINSFFNKYIYQIYSYFSYDFFNENDEINKNNYIKKTIIELTNEKSKNCLIDYIKQIISDKIINESSFNIKKILPKIYISDNIFQKDDTDFFEVIKSYIYSSLKTTLFQIINILEKNNILCPIIFVNNNLDENAISLYKKIIEQFFISFDLNSYVKPKEEYNSNKIKMVLGLNIPGSIFWFKELKNIFLIEQNIIKRYQNNEDILILNNLSNQENDKNKTEYENEYNKLIRNTEEQIKKNIYINNIIALNNNNNEVRKELIYDFIKLYISDLSKKFSSEKNNNIKYNYSLIINFIEIILSLKFGEEKNFIEKISLYEYQKYINILSSIILFLESSSYEILSLSEIFILLSNYIKNLLQKLSEKIKLLNKNNSFNDIYCLIINSLIELIFNNHDDINDLTIFNLYQFFEKMKYIKIITEKINKKRQINNLDILNTLDILLLIYEISTKTNDNSDLFKKFLIEIIQNLNEEINYIKNKNNDGLKENIEALIKILENKFMIKYSDEYYFIINKIYRIYHNRINDESFRFLMFKYSFENKRVNYNLVYFLNSIFDINFNNDLNNIFDFFEKEEKNKYLLFLDEINTEIFNQILLYYFELFFNKFFSLQVFPNKFNYSHLNQAINYIVNTKANNNIIIINNNLSNLKLIFSISYIKVFFHHFSILYINNKINQEEIINQFNSMINSYEENNKSIKYVLQIYFFKCVYYNNKEIDNINKLNNYIISKNDIPFKKDYLEYHKQIKKEVFIFENCFIPMDNIDIYMQEKNKIKEINKNNLNIEFDSKEGFDIFYCLFINHVFSPIFDIDNINKEEANLVLNNFIKDFEQNIINRNIIITKNNKSYIEIFKNLYTKDILNKYNIQSQKQLEILFYSIRFVLSSINIENNNSNYYSQLITSYTSEIIFSSYVPGTTPFNNVYLNSYYALLELMPITNENEYGFYICSCGQYYTLGKCTCPAYQFNCQNCGLIIGGIGHYLEEREDHFRLYLNKEKFNENIFARDEVISNKIPYMFFDEYKKKYIDKYLNLEPKGINKEDISFFIERKHFNIRKMSELTFRLLNFILYSHLLCANVLGNLSDDVLNNKYTHGNFTCFQCMEKDWEIIEIILKEKEINNIKAFMNIIFSDISSLLKQCENMDLMDNRRKFEENVDKYINGLINNKESLKEKLDKYKKYNEKVKNSEPNYIDEIISENYPPIEQYYPEKKYPLLNYFMKSEYPDINLLYNELILIRNYQNKYPLINQVIINNEEFRLLSNLNNINRLSNKLLKKYSYKISREEGQNISLFFSEKDEKEFLAPYIKSWDEIKKFCTRYLCRPDMPILNLDKKMTLNYFLVDDGQLGGGMYLASAYSNFIEWQNKFIALILDNVNQDSVLYCYVEQLSEEIYVQDAKEENILRLDDNIIEKLNDIIRVYSIRNIFEDKDINYSNYRRIKFNFDEIESELGKLILPGLKKFKSNEDPIKFMVYLYEGNRSQKSQILLKYETKYPSQELNIQEKKVIFNFLYKYENKRKKIIEFLFSCQILIDYIVKENYNILNSISDIIKELPIYIELNKDLKQFFYENKNFSVNKLLNIYKYFEHFSWKEIKLNINEQYKEKIEKDKKIEIINFFKAYEPDKNNKLITKRDLAFALRRLVSRYLAGKRGDTDIDEKQKLIGQIIRYDLWDNYIIQNEDIFQNEIYHLTFDLKVSQAFDFYEILDGDSYDIFDIKEMKNDNPENGNKIESFINDIL